jgi:hypothetical protein
VTAGPVITLNPSDVTVNAGQTATFTAAATGIPTPTVQWQFSTDGGATFNNVAGATTTTAATLTVNFAPTVTLNPTSQSVAAGSTASFTAATSGNPTPTVQWQQSTDGGATFLNIAGATATTLSFTASTGQNGNQYRAVFTNSVGSATTTAATLTVSTGTTNLGATSTGKSGPSDSRQWNFTIVNTGPGAANGAQITSFTLVQSGGPACTPVIGTVSVNGGGAQALPNVQLGNMAPASSIPVVVTIDFTGCGLGARFTETMKLSANGGATTASVPRYNQFP